MAIPYTAARRPRSEPHLVYGCGDFQRLRGHWRPRNLPCRKGSDVSAEAGYRARAVVRTGTGDDALLRLPYPAGCAKGPVLAACRLATRVLGCDTGEPGRQSCMGGGD